MNIKLAKDHRWTWELDGERFSDGTKDFDIEVSKKIDILLPSSSIDELQKTKVKS